MKYVIQLNTGSYEKYDYQVEEIIKRLEYITNHIEVTMVIFGWYKDPLYNKQLCDYLRGKNIKSIFKLPIFSEITDLNKEDDYIYYKDELNIKDNHFYKGDKFDFVCPNSDKNTNFILNVFKEIDNYANFDGVFFDRIRYPASSVKKTSIYGCQCEECKKMYKDIDIESIQSFKPIKIEGMHYIYQDENANKLMQVKRDVITRQVKKLRENLKDKIIGIDTFSLNLSDLVGQDILSLSKYVDFIKPMNYYKTFAPAGIPYEFNTLDNDLKEGIKALWKEDILSIESSKEMSEELLKLGNRITIGIDANYVKDICLADINYVTNHISKLDEVGIKEVVLSWNSMLLSDDLIKALENI